MTFFPHRKTTEIFPSWLQQGVPSLIKEPARCFLLACVGRSSDKEHLKLYLGTPASYLIPFWRGFLFSQVQGRRAVCVLPPQTAGALEAPGPSPSGINNRRLSLNCTPAIQQALHYTNCLKFFTPKLEKSCNLRACHLDGPCICNSRICLSASVTKNHFPPVFLQRGSWSLISKAGPALLLSAPEFHSHGPCSCVWVLLCAPGCPLPLTLRVMAPENVHLLEPWMCYLTKDFADVITWRTLRWGDSPGLSEWAPCNL